MTVPRETSAGDPWPAPAKLNRFLHVLGRRSDGYHELQTLFQFLDLADTLRFELRDDAVIRRVTPIPGVSEAHDLMLRAARALQQHSATSAGADIHIDKRIPLGGGLGGGSSNAATVLVALNHLWNTGCSEQTLAALGLSLGADVPVFVHGRAAWAEGVGERLTPIEPDRPWFVVLTPDCAVDTAGVFGDPHLTRSGERLKIRAVVETSDRNDCEAVVYRRYPEVAVAASSLAEFGQARMTGTGACVFAAFGSEQQARDVLSSMPAGLNGFVSRGCNRSLLHDRLRRAKMTTS